MNWMLTFALISVCLGLAGVVVLGFALRDACRNVGTMPEQPAIEMKERPIDRHIVRFCAVIALALVAGCFL